MESMIDRETFRTNDIVNDESVDFENLLLSDSILHGLRDVGFLKPSPIQLKAIPIGKCGFDLIVQSKNGTGKTCVFSVIALESIDSDFKCIQALILAPTREIVSQIYDVLVDFSKYMTSVCCQLFIGGNALAEDAKRLKHCHIAIATPGRFEHFLKEGIVDITGIRLLVLDEADKLLEKEFEDAINWIYSSLPVSKQIIACSATMPEWLANCLQSYMHQPTTVRLNSKHLDLIGVAQYVKVVKILPNENALKAKCRTLLSILPSIHFTQCIIYLSNQIRGEDVCRMLLKQGWSVVVIGSGQDQESRLRAITKLKSMKCKFLVSTDLTSRGLDVPNVDLVINVDLPMTFDTYLHRIGRAGRFGRYGASISLVCQGNEQFKIQRITKLCSVKLLELPDDVSAILNRWSPAPVDQSLLSLNSTNNQLIDSDDITDIPLHKNDRLEKTNNCYESNQAAHSYSNCDISSKHNDFTKCDYNCDLETPGHLKYLNATFGNKMPKLPRLESTGEISNDYLKLEKYISDVPTDNHLRSENDSFKYNANESIMTSLISDFKQTNLQRIDQHLNKETDSSSVNHTEISINGFINGEHDLKFQDSKNLLLKNNDNLKSNLKVDELSMSLENGSEKDKENVIVHTLNSKSISKNNYAQITNAEFLVERFHLNEVDSSIDLQENKSDYKMIKYSTAELYDIGKNLKDIRIDVETKKAAVGLKILKNSQIEDSRSSFNKNRLDKNRVPRKYEHGNYSKKEFKHPQLSSDLSCSHNTSILNNCDTNVKENGKRKNPPFKAVNNENEIYCDNLTYSYTKDDILVLEISDKPPELDEDNKRNLNSMGIYVDEPENYYVENINGNDSYKTGIADDKVTSNKLLEKQNKIGDSMDFTIKENKENAQEANMEGSSVMITHSFEPFESTDAPIKNLLLKKNNLSRKKLSKNAECENKHYYISKCKRSKDATNDPGEYLKSDNYDAKTRKEIKPETFDDFNWDFIPKNKPKFNKKKPEVSNKIKNNFSLDEMLHAENYDNENKFEKLTKKFVDDTSSRKKKSSNKFYKNTKIPNPLEGNFSDIHHPDNANNIASFYWSQYQYHSNMALQYHQHYELIVSHQRYYSVFNNCVDYIRSMSCRRE